MAMFLTLLLAVGCLHLAASSGCPSNIPSGTPTAIYQQYCYVFVGHRLPYSEARQACTVYGATLASDPSKEVNAVLVKLMTDANYTGEAWIGLNDIEWENHFEWEDGTNFIFENWGTGEGPRRGIRHFFEDCVGLSTKDQKWHDHNCGGLFGLFGTKLPFICEFQEATSTQAPTAANTTDV